MSHNPKEPTKVGLHVRMFNDRVRAMNQTQSRDLVLTAQEARNLHADIFALLNRLAETETPAAAPPNNEITQLNLDGGLF